MFEQLIDNNLVWRLENQLHTEQELGFLRRIQSRLCLFSGSVHTLFADYQLFQRRGAKPGLSSLARQERKHMLQRNISDAAISATGLYVIPALAANDANHEPLRLAYRSSKNGKVKSLPLSKGLKKLQQGNRKSRLLPVIVNESLALDNSMPCLPLYHIDLDKLPSLPEQQKRALSKMVQRKLAAND